jgi:hypothetical protein
MILVIRMTKMTKQYPLMNPIDNPESHPDLEAALRTHINYVVRNYALENICTDHIEWTHKKVSKVSCFWVCWRSIKLKETRC